jgi:hypothetical protein
MITKEQGISREPRAHLLQAPVGFLSYDLLRSGTEARFPRIANRVYQRPAWKRLGKETNMARVALVTGGTRGIGEALEQPMKRVAQ